MDFSYSIEDIEKILGRNEFKSALPLYSDSELWRKARRKPEARDLLKTADLILNEQIPNLLYSQYKEIDRSGRREPYEEPMYKRHNNLDSLVIAECISRKGKYLDAIQDHIWLICEETTWVAPAHTKADDILQDRYSIEIFAAMWGQRLAEINVMLGDILDRVVKGRISDELDKRLFTPFLEKDFYFNKINNNFNSVCHCGVVTAAVLQNLEAGRLARIIHKMLLE